MGQRLEAVDDSISGMFVSRRRFLGILFVAAGGAASAAVGFDPLRDALRRLAHPVLDQAPTGPLGEGTLKTLLAATDVLVGYPIEEGHYADFFRWHSENLRGYKALYERFTSTVNHAARRSCGRAFVECGTVVRRRILDLAFQLHRAHRSVDRLRLAAFHRDWLLFDRYIVRPTTTLFANTDAWRLVGYDSWPGIPQGLEGYTQPPSRKTK